MTAEDEAKQLDSVTDRVQEKELDASRANQALGALGATALSSGVAAGTGVPSASDSGKAVAVRKEDVDAIMVELDVTEDEAAGALREVLEREGTNINNIEGQELVVEALRRLVVS